VAACGGTHVRNTREIGPVTVLGRSNPGEGRTRIEFPVGRTGVERRTAEKRAVLDAAAALGTRVADVPDAVGRLREERDALSERAEDLEGRLVDARLAASAVVEDVTDEFGGGGGGSPRSPGAAGSRPLLTTWWRCCAASADDRDRGRRPVSVRPDRAREVPPAS